MATVSLHYISVCEGNPLPQSGGIIRTNNPAFDLFFAPELIVLNAINPVSYTHLRANED